LKFYNTFEACLGPSVFIISR